MDVRRFNLWHGAPREAPAKLVYITKPVGLTANTEIHSFSSSSKVPFGEKHDVIQWHDHPSFLKFIAWDHPNAGPEG